MVKKQTQIIILFGRSGCGKGTQAKLLIKNFGFEYLGSGALLRERSVQKDFTGQKLKKVMERGTLVPTPIMFKIWSEKIEEIREKINKKGVILDGSPRTFSEAELMNSAFKWYEWENIKVILLDISESEAFDRLTQRRICQECSRLIPWTSDFRGMKVCDQCGGELITRDDDKPEAIRRRLAYFKKDVQPAIDYYEKQGRLIKIDGERPIEDVAYEVKKQIR